SETHGSVIRSHARGGAWRAAIVAGRTQPGVPRGRVAGRTAATSPRATPPPQSPAAQLYVRLQRSWHRRRLVYARARIVHRHYRPHWLRQNHAATRPAGALAALEWADRVERPPDR